MSSRRFRLEAALCALLVCLAAAALVYGRSSNAWRLVFALRHGGSTSDGPAASDGGSLSPLVLPATAATESRRLHPNALRGDSDYLLELLVMAGPRFKVLTVGQEDGRATWSASLPPRARKRLYRVVIPAGRGDINDLLRVAFRGRGELEIGSGRVLGLHWMSRWAGRSVIGLVLVVLAVFLLRHRRRAWQYLARPKLATGAADTRIWDGLAGVVIFTACFFAFWSAPVTQIIDSRYVTAVSHRILTAATLELPENIAPDRGGRLPHMLQDVDGRVYHYYSQAVPVLNVPFVAAFSAAGFEPLSLDGEFLRHHEVRILRFAAASQAALLCALLFALARLYVSPTQSVALALVFAFGTQIASTVSRPYWSHGWAILLLAAALVVLLSAHQDFTIGRAITVASLLSWSFFCRPTMALAVVALGVYVAWRHRRRLVPFVAAGGVWAIAFSVFSLRTFGSILPPYFFRAQLDGGALGIDVYRTSYLEALAGTLVSPARGLFLYVPVTVVILLLAARRWRRLRDKALAFVAVSVIVAHWQLLSSNRIWWGGQSFGPRLFADVLPWFLLLAAMSVASEVADPDRAGRRGRLGVVFTVGLAVVISIFVNYRGAMVRETIAWNEDLLWAWDHPQALAGLLTGREPPTDDGDEDGEAVDTSPVEAPRE